MERRSGIITLTTDFGTRDAYVGAMKGVMYRILPSAHLVDISHLIPPRRIVEAALLLEGAYPWFPTGTVHVVVVDPGVGTNRRPIALAAGGQLFVGPDNGVLSAPLAERDARAFEITEITYELPERSETFHGRDVFAPAAAHLASGIDIERLGPPAQNCVRIDLPKPRIEDGAIHGEILRIDRFGNALSNIPRAMLSEIGSGELEVLLGERSFGKLMHRYQDVPAEMPLALIGGDGRVELAVNGGSAARLYGIEAGQPVRVRSLGEPAG